MIKIIKKTKHMKKLILSIIFASIALTTVNAAPCKAEHNWYLQATSSYGWHNKSKINAFEQTHKEHQKRGFGGALAIGYILDCWRLELEGSHRYNGYKSKSAVGIKSNSSLMANVYYDIPVTDLISIYFGAGAGISSVNGQSIKSHSDDSKFVKFKKKRGHLDTVFAWQAMSGISYAISDNVDLIAGYRLFATAKPTIAKIGKEKIKLKNIPVTQSVELGLRFKF